MCSFSVLDPLLDYATIYLLFNVRTCIYVAARILNTKLSCKFADYNFRRCVLYSI